MPFFQINVLTAHDIRDSAVNMGYPLDQPPCDGCAFARSTPNASRDGKPLLGRAVAALLKLAPAAFTTLLAWVMQQPR